MTQNYSFNLIDEPWIPCVQLDGSPITLNIRGVFLLSHQISSIAGDSPPITISIFRFLLTLLHRIFGPADEDQWVDLWKAKTWNMSMIDKYLDQWHHRFDLLDHEHPFYQASDPRMKPKSIISLSHDRASGNNPAFFDHHTETIGESLKPAQAVRILLAGQTFGLAGLSGIKQKFTDGTCAAGIIYMFTGENLKQTLILNMIKYPPDNDQFIHTNEDRPAWEMEDPFTPTRSTPLGYLDYLTWQNRRILFKPTQINGEIVVRDITMGPALRYNPEILDPMKNYRRHTTLGPLTISFREDKSFWRDSASLFAFAEDPEEQPIPPITLRWLRYLLREMGIPEKHQTYATQAIGMAKKQAKVYFFRHERLPLPLDYLTDNDLVAKLKTALKTAESIAYDLVQSARLMGMVQQISKVEERNWQNQWSGLNVNAKSSILSWIDHTGMERNYWSDLDIPFQSFMIELAKDQEKALARWHQTLRNAALSAFQLAASSTGEDARAFKAVVRAEAYLRYRLNQVLPEPVKEEIV